MTVADAGFHEGKCCDAVLKWLENRLGLQRSSLRSPEKEHDPAPVEFTCSFGSQLFALEHTGVEPFEGHVRLQAEAERDFGPIYAAVAGRLPASDLFELQIPARAMQALTRRQRETAQAAVASWIITKAPAIPHTPFGRYGRSPNVREAPPGVPFAIALHRFEKPVGVERDLTITHVVQASTSSADRETRIEQACAKKFPKLAEWKRKAGARTILVLEDNDLQLSNPQVIYEALAAAERRVPNPPDEVHLVVTCVELEWWHFRLRADQLTYYQMAQLGGGMTSFDPALLADLRATV
jgi:hypothetical protein